MEFRRVLFRSPIEKFHRRQHEQPDVTPSLASCMSSVMRDADCRYPRQRAARGGAQAEIVVLEIEEKILRVAAEFRDRRSAAEHEASTQKRNAFRRAIARQVVYFIPLKMPFKNAFHEIGREATQREG